MHYLQCILNKILFNINCLKIQVLTASAPVVINEKRESQEKDQIGNYLLMQQLNV